MLVAISIIQDIDRNIYYHFTTAALNKTNWYEKYLIKMECYYFDDIIEIEDFDFNNILIDKKSYQNILVYSISCNLVGAKPLRIRFDKVDEFIRVYDGIKYLVLLSPEKCDSISNRTRYLIGEKSGIT